jgi:hypothetical protein
VATLVRFPAFDTGWADLVFLTALIAERISSSVTLLLP